MPRLWLLIGAISAGLSVAAGAFAAHGLRARVAPDLLVHFETGARYQMYHALALIAVGLLAGKAASLPASISAWSFLVGTVFFSGSLYLLALTGVTRLGMITPIGGLAFLVGWGAFAWAALSTTSA